VGPWLHYWIENEFVPYKINIVVMEYEVDSSFTGFYLEEFLLTESDKSISSLPTGSCGQTKLYTCLKMPLDLVSALPVFLVVWPSC